MNWLRRLMAGRYGVDELSIALLAADLLLSILGSITRLWIFSILSFLIVIVLLLRVFSKKIYVRQKENQTFLRYWNPIKRSISQANFRMRDRSHRYIRCKKCKERLRLPRGKGRIEVTCPKCRERFITKT